MNMNFQKFWKKRSVTITEYDPTYKVVYLGNVLTAWAKGDGCSEKPLATLWKNYCQNAKPDVMMKVTVGNSGLKAVTKEHGLTEYWANRITYCAAPSHYPRVFCWVYRHEGKRLRQELRCHAVLCTKRGDQRAHKMAAQLQAKLAESLQEFKREKISRQNARLSLANSVYDNPSLPRRKILLSTGSANYRPPVERSKSAPKLTAIEEWAGEDVISNKSFEELTADQVPGSGGRKSSTASRERNYNFSVGQNSVQNNYVHQQATMTASTPLMTTTSRVKFNLSYLPDRYDPREDQEYEEDDDDRQRLNLLNGTLDLRLDDDDEDDQDIDGQLNGNELDDIEVCLFDPTGRSVDHVVRQDDDDEPNRNGPLELSRIANRGLDDFNNMSCESASTTSSSSTSPTSLRGLTVGVGLIGQGVNYSNAINDRGDGDRDISNESCFDLDRTRDVSTTVQNGDTSRNRIMPTCSCAI